MNNDGYNGFDADDADEIHWAAMLRAQRGAEASAHAAAAAAARAATAATVRAFNAAAARAAADAARYARTYHVPLTEIPQLAHEIDTMLNPQHDTASNGGYPTLYARAIAGQELRKRYWEAYDLHCVYPMFTAAIWVQMEPYDKDIIRATLSGRIGRC